VNAKYTKTSPPLCSKLKNQTVSKKEKRMIRVFRLLMTNQVESCVAKEEKWDTPFLPV
jgi:hypothetical protein